MKSNLFTRENSDRKEVNIMKKMLILTLALLLTAGLYTLASANGQGDGIVGSPHDFTDGMESSGVVPIDEAWNARKEICRVCHVPHDHGLATKYYTNGLLWNHKVDETTAFTMYNNAWSSTIDQTVSAQPDGTAKLCLGCHDGAVAVDTYDKYAGGSVTIDTYDAGFKVPGFGDGDLRGTHPISITYPTAGVTDEFQPAANTWSGGESVSSTLDNGKVQCSTCHDVHDQESVSGTHLLRSPQTVAQGGTASQLCLTCHIK